MQVNNCKQNDSLLAPEMDYGSFGTYSICTGNFQARHSMNTAPRKWAWLFEQNTADSEYESRPVRTVEAKAKSIYRDMLFHMKGKFIAVMDSEPCGTACAKSQFLR
jgi:hypothetical protein